MIYVGILAALAVAWGLHCWSVWRAFKAGFREGSDHTIRQVSAW